MGRLLKTKPVQMALGALIAAHMAVVKRTVRWEVRGFERVDDIVGTDQGMIGLVFHSRFLMLNAAWRRGWQMPHVMISRSAEGDIVHYATRALGVRTIRGSTQRVGKSDKGGSRAGAEAREAVRAGACVVITPDGPRGPRQRMQIGALRLARMTGAPLVPCSFAVSRRWTVRTWDRTAIPKGFGRGVIQWGEPVRIPADTDDLELEQIRADIEARMNADLASVDAATGHPALLPAPSPPQAKTKPA